MPLFLQSQSHAVAIPFAGGDTGLTATVQGAATAIDFNALTGVGIILDADSDKSPSDRYVTLRDGLRAKGFPFPDDPGVVSSTPPTPRFGAFVLPDNQAQGTLEDLLLECGQLVYASLLATATIHVDTASQDQSLLNEDLEELRKPAGRIKAIVGSIASVLRPGRAVQVSIQDNRWLRDSAALAIPKVRAVQDFLANLLELP
jgi:hypothetical protein